MLSKLREIYGDRLVNIFEGTRLEEEGRKHGFGGFVVRGAICRDVADQYHAALNGDMQRHAMEKGLRAIQLKGSKLWYNTIQCATGSCTCKYNYEGIGRHPLFKVSEVPSVNNLTQWLHNSYVPERQEHFNQVVANVYARELDQNIPWHSDHNSLLAENTDICSLTPLCGELAVFCAPRGWPPSPSWPPPR